MNRSPKLKPTLWDALVVLAGLALAGLLAARPFLAAKTAGELTVSISVDGETVERCALSTYEGGTYKSRGYTLTVEVADGAVYVASGDCPNQDCVHPRAVPPAGQSIVCPPARVAPTPAGQP